jgi:NAD(P)-dependent dehydrogenase (short-subunit alcohol dehydrogenase family)
MLLESMNAIIYGGGGAIGSAVARAFSREGARVYLAGRTPETLEKVAEVIRGDVGSRAAHDRTGVQASSWCSAAKATRGVATTWAGCRLRFMPWKRCDDNSLWSSASTASAS